jgi:hypothetical protein
MMPQRGISLSTNSDGENESQFDWRNRHSLRGCYILLVQPGWLCLYVANAQKMCVCVRMCVCPHARGEKGLNGVLSTILYPAFRPLTLSSLCPPSLKWLSASMVTKAGSESPSRDMMGTVSLLSSAQTTSLPLCFSTTLTGGELSLSQGPPQSLSLPYYISLPKGSL